MNTTTKTIRYEAKLVDEAIKVSGMSYRQLLELGAKTVLGSEGHPVRSQKCANCGRTILLGDRHISRGPLQFDCLSCLEEWFNKRLQVKYEGATPLVLAAEAGWGYTFGRRSYLLDPKGAELKCVDSGASAEALHKHRCIACGLPLKHSVIAGKGDKLYHTGCLLPASTEALHAIIERGLLDWKVANAARLSSTVLSVDIEEYTLEGEHAG